MANPIQIIMDDHRAVESLFEEYEAHSDTAVKTKHGTALEIAKALTLHAEMEETFFYPRLKEQFASDGDALVDEAYDDHQEVKDLVAGIEEMDADDPELDDRMRELKSSVMAHVEEEENDLLPRAEKELSEDALEELGQQMETFKEVRTPLEA